MKTLYVVRHGESQANADGIVAGGLLDSPLTERGRVQAHETAQKIKELDFDVMISSTQVRATETSSIIATEIGWPQAVATDNRLSELIAGDETGSPIDEYNKLLDSGAYIPNAETLQDLYVRVQQFLKDLSARPESSFLIVSHSGTARMIRAITSGNVIESFHTTLGQGNGEVMKVVFDEAA